MERLINEFRIVETDDGFRIEIKGDKEAIRRMLNGWGLRDLFRKSPSGHGFHFGFGPGVWGGFGGGCSPEEGTDKGKKGYF